MRVASGERTVFDVCVRTSDRAGQDIEVEFRSDSIMIIANALMRIERDNKGKYVEVTIMTHETLVSDIQEMRELLYDKGIIRSAL